MRSDMAASGTTSKRIKFVFGFLNKHENCLETARCLGSKAASNVAGYLYACACNFDLCNVKFQNIKLLF